MVICVKCGQRDKESPQIVIKDQEYEEYSRDCGWKKSENPNDKCSSKTNEKFYLLDCDNLLMITLKKELICLLCEFTEPKKKRDAEKIKEKSELQRIRKMGHSLIHRYQHYLPEE